MSTDMFTDWIMKKAVWEDDLNRAFNTRTVHEWPNIPRKKPGILDRSDRKLENRINAALSSIGHGPITEEMREVYWKEVRKGQSFYEDAGGYCARCWAVTLGYQEPEAINGYSGYSEA